MKVKHIFFTLIPLLIASVLFTNVFVFAQNSGGSDEIKVLNEEIAARKDKIKQLEETIGKYKKAIAEKETQAVSLKNQLSIISNRKSQIETDIELTKEKIAQVQLEIDALNISIQDKQKVIAKQKKIISKLIQSINAGDQKNYLEILLTYEDFSDFYNGIREIENVYVDLGKSVKTLRLASEDLTAKRSQVESKRKVYKGLELQLEGKKGDLENQENYKENLLSQTKSSEARYKTLLSSLKEQYQIIENEQRSYEEKLKKKLEEQDKIQNSGSVTMGWPVLSHVINAYFHDADYPYKKVFEHNAIDIRASQGTPVRAVASGYVARARRCTVASCYSYVMIVHTGSLSTVYGHLSSISVTDEQFVNKGDIIGYSGGKPGTVGAGPFTTGPHLHFEVRLNGIPVDPLNYVDP